MQYTMTEKMVFMCLFSFPKDNIMVCSISSSKLSAVKASCLCVAPVQQYC